MKDMTTDEIREVFSQDLFKKVKHVGISGGEPFLRKDLFKIVETLVETLPKLKSISIITNASIPNTFETTQNIKSYLIANHIRFSLEVSIDGIGEIHDLNRGVKGAFEKTFKNFKKLNDECLVDTISTTITRNNIRTLYDNLDFARKYNVPIDFRLASCIDRLYNRDKAEKFNFSEEDKLLIIKFLNNIISNYENRLWKKIFYTSLIEQLSGKTRRSGCEFETSNGMSLDPYGNIYFCFPRSPALYNALEHKLTISHLKKDETIIKSIHEHCNSCTHDYYGIPDVRLVWDFIYKRYLFIPINYIKNSILLIKNTPPDKLHKSALPKKEIKNVCIIGWYGTETLGDKAILGGIINNLIQIGISPQNITIASLNVNYTKLTLHQMNLTKIQVIDSYELKYSKKLIESQDAFIFGGGPLCDIEPMVDMYGIFRSSKLCGKINIIYSCGIGPLKTRRYIKTLVKLLKISDITFFRDSYSVEKYVTVVPDLKRYENNIFIDPAVAWIKSNYDKAAQIRNDEYVLACIRDWPYMYADSLEYGEYLEKKHLFENALADQIRQFLKNSLHVILFPMNVDYAGYDDREYYRYFINKFNFADKVEVVNWDYTPLEALSYFKYARFVLAVRFHSAVFSVASNTPCIAIDYHYGNGKITGFMKEIGLNEMVFNIDEFINNKLIMPDILNQKNCFEDTDSKLNSVVNKMYDYFADKFKGDA